MAFPTREEVFYDLCKSLHSIVEVKGTVSGFRTRLARNKQGYKHQITLAPVCINGVWVDHLNIDITNRMRAMLDQKNVLLGDRVRLKGKLKLYQQFRYRICAPHSLQKE